jgi:hypothetical protein
VISFLLIAGLLLAELDSAEVAALVHSLDSRELQERDAAERKLEALGPAVLKQLPAFDDEKLSAEAAGRVKRLRQKLLRAQAIRTAEPTLITLTAKDQPMAEVLAEIAQQSGNPIKDHREAFGQVVEPRKLSVAYEKKQFWPALDEVLDQGQLTVYGYSGEDGLAIVNRAPGAGPRAARASYSGAFRLEPKRLEAVRDLTGGGQGGLRLILEIAWEPRLKPFALLMPLDELRVETEVGLARLTNPEAEPETIVRGGSTAAELDILFDLPPREAKHLTHAVGQITAILPGPLEEFRFRQLPVFADGKRPQHIAQTQGGTTVTLDSLRPNEDLWELNLRIKFEAPSEALESHRGWMLNNEAVMIDSEGLEIPSFGIEQTLQAEEIGLKYLFELTDGTDNLTFVYRTPLIVLELPVKYEFKDLPLP